MNKKKVGGMRGMNAGLADDRRMWKEEPDNFRRSGPR